MIGCTVTICSNKSMMFVHERLRLDILVLYNNRPIHDDSAQGGEKCMIASCITLHISSSQYRKPTTSMSEYIDGREIWL